MNLFDRKTINLCKLDASCLHCSIINTATRNRKKHEVQWSVSAATELFFFHFWIMPRCAFFFSKKIFLLGSHKFPEKLGLKIAPGANLWSLKGFPSSQRKLPSHRINAPCQPDAIRRHASNNKETASEKKDIFSTLNDEHFFYLMMAQMNRYIYIYETRILLQKVNRCCLWPPSKNECWRWWGRKWLIISMK